MALKDMNLSGKVRAGNGDGVQDATVSLRATAANLAGTAHGTTDTTDSAGTWEFTIEGSTYALTNAWDVEVASGDSKRYLAWSDQIALKGVDTSYLKIRGIGDTDPAPLYFIADRGEDVGDIWRMQATNSDTLTIGNNKASVNAIIDYVTITNGANAAASVVALGGDLTVGDDLSLTSDSAVFNMGADSGFSITHDGDIGATIAGSPITITAAEASTWSTSSGALTITSAAALNLNPAGGYSVLLDGTVHVDAGLITGVASIFEADVRIGEDDQTKIDFETADEIHFYAANVEQVYVADNIFGPQSDSDVDLGTTGVRWKDAFVDSITVTGEVDGASLDISGDADIGNDLTLSSDSAVLNIGADSDAKLTHDGAYGLTISATPISIDATGELHLNSTTGDIKLQDGGTDQIAFDLDSTAGDVIIKTMVNGDDIVFKQYDSGEVLRLTDGGNVEVKDTLSLKSDSALLKFGADAEVILTHLHDVGLGLNSTMKLTFGDTASFVQQSSDGTLRIDGEAIIDLNASTRVDVSGDIKVGGEVQTASIGYTDGDNAMTIADGGGVTFPVSIDVTGSTGIILENDETITNSTDGEVAINGTVVIGTGSAAGTLKSSGNHDITMQTGNSTTGSITITDGANGDIAISPNGSGDINIPANIGLTFGDDGEKIEGDGTDLTISGNIINLTPADNVKLNGNVGIGVGANTVGTDFAGGGGDYNGTNIVSLQVGTTAEPATTRGFVLVQGTTDAAIIFGDSGGGSDDKKMTVLYQGGELDLGRIDDSAKAMNSDDVAIAIEATDLSVKISNGDLNLNNNDLLNVGASGNDWTGTLLSLQNTALLKIGATTAHGTTAGTNLISLFNGTAPAGTLSNGASFFCASGEMKVIDAAGNITVLSPHDDNNQWVFHSKNSVTGKVLHIHMEKLMRRLDEELGGGFIEEFLEV